MKNRSFICLCASLCTLIANVPFAAGQQDPQTAVLENDDLSVLTLDEVKAVAAKRSSYLKRATRSASSGTAKIPKANLAEFQKFIQPILKTACVDCHGPDTEEGNIRIDSLDPNLLTGKDVDWWVEVLAVLSKGEMPPKDAEPLEDDDRAKLVEWLSNEIQIASTVRRATGGHSSFRRMTRYEYNYAMQDLLGLPWDFAKDLPPEPHSDDGFQNSSEMLHMTVTQLETYRQLALKALKRATVKGDRPDVIHWGITMESAVEKQLRKRSEQLEKLKENHKDDPEKQKKEVERFIANGKRTHNRPYYRELSSGETVRSEWSYIDAKYASKPSPSAPVDPQFPESFDHVAVIPSGQNQYVTVELGETLPDEGTMRIRIRASRSATQDDRIPNLQLLYGFQASNEGKATMRISDDTPITATTNAPKIYQWDVPLGEIYPRNSFRKTAKLGGLPSPSEYIRFVNNSVEQGKHGDIQFDYVEVTAPVYDQWPPESHTRIFFESKNRDKASENEAPYAREVISAFMSKAWRQPATTEDIDQKVTLFAAMRKQCDSFEEAIVEVLASVLSSPNFLYIVKEHSDTDEHSKLRPHELATRLSTFLWCSIPDEQLLELANSGQLSQSEVLTTQVERMLADSRSQRFAKHFVHQWLDMQLLDFLTPNKKAAFFDGSLKESMQNEPIELFREIVRNDSSVLDFIHADYTMINERLAVHYGLPNVRGNHFRRVKLDPGLQRGGLLTQSGLLAMNSNGTDSHPLKRGVWLLESLLNDPPPPPPPAVPEIDLADPEIAKLTLKQQIENHRNHAACMSCHAKIDPWGIAFENYDAYGRWRKDIDGKPVDASSLLFNKQKLDGMDGLKRFLLQNRQDQFVRAMVYKISTYALGRPLTFGDHASIDNIAAEVRKQGDGLATLIRLIVTSDLFQSK